MDNRFKGIIEKYRDITESYEKQIKVLEKELLDTNANYQEDIIVEFKKWLSESRFYKTNDGYIAVNEVKQVHIGGLSRHAPRITLAGFYIRGIDCEQPAKHPYGYYDTLSGHLLSELKPVSSEVFCEKVKTVCNDIITKLPYRPTYLYRKEGDIFDQFLKDAKKGGIYIEYYPEINVSLI